MQLYDKIDINVLRFEGASVNDTKSMEYDFSEKGITIDCTDARPKLLIPIVLAAVISVVIHYAILSLLKFFDDSVLTQVDDINTKTLSLRLKNSFSKVEINNPIAKPGVIQNDVTKDVLSSESLPKKNPTLEIPSSDSKPQFKVSIKEQGSLKNDPPTFDRTVDPGAIFDPRFRKRIHDAEMRKNKSALPNEYHSYRNTFGDDIFAKGEKCFTISPRSEMGAGRRWSLPTRCPGVKSQSEKMAGNIKRRLEEIRDINRR